MQTREIVVIVLNGLLLGALVLLLGLGKIDWSHFAAGVALLGVPSAAHVAWPSVAKALSTDGPTILVVAAVSGFAGSVLGCATLQAQKEAAEAEFAHEQLRCVDAEPALPATATSAERAAARARVDMCRQKVREKWGITETQTSNTGVR